MKKTTTFGQKYMSFQKITSAKYDSYQIFLRTVILCFLCSYGLDANAQFTDNFDSYPLGNIAGQGNWVIYSGATSGQVSNAQSFSGNNSFHPRNNNTDDTLVKLGNKTSGTWSVRFMVYAPGPGYFNIQQNETGQPLQFNGEYFIGEVYTSNGYYGGFPGLVTHNTTGNTAPYPSDAWFPITIVLNYLDEDGLWLINVDVNGTPLIEDDIYMTNAMGIATQLGAINFFSVVDANFYIDDFELFEGNLLSIEKASKLGLKLFPNPVSDVLNIEANTIIDHITVFDMLGKTILQVAPNSLSTLLDMSEISKGIYFVKVDSNETSETLRILR